MRTKDLTGQRFGKLTVVKRVPTPLYVKKQRPYYECECECGNVRIVLNKNLTSGNTKSCGCLSKEIAKELKPGTILSNGIVINFFAGWQCVDKVWSKNIKRRRLYNYNCFCGNELVDHLTKIREMTHCVCRYKKTHDKYLVKYANLGGKTIIQAVRDHLEKYPYTKKSVLRKKFYATKDILGKFEQFNAFSFSEINETINRYDSLSLEEIMIILIQNEMAYIDDIFVALNKARPKTFLTEMIEKRIWESWTWLEPEDKERFIYYFGDGYEPTKEQIDSDIELERQHVLRMEMLKELYFENIIEKS